ncbi:MAG: type II toxin-antitoxin system VapC family toxin [Desulfuromonadales bacterium]|nr:type II toxin-antitoxin system VapC family toxin [Desulfuromonadales bacterium]
MGVIFDSSEIIALERNRGLVEALVVGREDELFGISVVTVAELLHGVERADTETRRLRRQAFVEKVIEVLPIFPFDVAAARIYARIWASLVQRGFTVGAHDLIIAATAISLDYTVITSNRRDFEKIEGLRLEVRGCASTQSK